MSHDTKELIEVWFWLISTVILLITMGLIFYAPIKAVKVAGKLDDIKGKENAKRDLFYILFAYRGNSMHPDFINGLNTIDIIFQDKPEVTSAWHSLRDAYSQSGLINKESIWVLLQTDLLSKMSECLGYQKLSQLDIASYYQPQGHVNQSVMDWEIKKAALSFLQTGDHLYKMMIDNSNNQTREAQTQEQEPKS